MPLDHRQILLQRAKQRTANRQSGIAQSGSGAGRKFSSQPVGKRGFQLVCGRSAVNQADGRRRFPVEAALPLKIRAAAATGTDTHAAATPRPREGTRQVEFPGSRAVRSLPPGSDRRPAPVPSPPPKHCPRTAAMVGAGRSAMRRSSAMQAGSSVSAICSGRCSCTLAPKLKWRPFADQHDGFQIPPSCKLVEGRLQFGHHRLIDDVGLGRGQRMTRATCAFVLEFLDSDFHR